MLPFRSQTQKKEDGIFTNAVLEHQESYDMFLVGRFLTEAVIKFDPMLNTLVYVWRPLRAVSLKELGNDRYLFCFFCEVDVERIINGNPWAFNNHLWVIHRLQDGEDLTRVEINRIQFWVQVHSLPMGCFYEPMAKQFNKFLGKFIKYDTRQVTNNGKGHMRLRVAVDVR